MRNACDLAYVYFIIEPKNALSPNLTLPHYEVGLFIYYIMLRYYILYYVILFCIIFYYITFAVYYRITDGVPASLSG